MDFNSVQGKVVIVTGASRGIGRAHCRMLWCPRHEGCLRCPQRGSGPGRVRWHLRQGGEAILSRPIAAAPPPSKNWWTRPLPITESWTALSAMRASVWAGTPLHEYDVTDYEKIFALNSEGVFAGMKYGAEAILKSHSEGGFLINVASIAGLVPQRGQALYSATKFGVVGMTRAAALDYAAYGITVNAICPGYTKTSIFGDAPASAMDFFASDCPAKRMGDPEECAALALFLASDMARYITGAAIPVDGALSAGHQSISSWKHPEILTDGKLNSQSTIAALMENDAAKVVIENFLPGFSANEQAKAAYGMTFAQIGPMLGLPDSALQGLLAALDNL